MNETAAVQEADQRRRRAMVDGDVDTLAELLADELVWTHSSGRRDGKAALLERLAAGAADYRSLEVTEESFLVQGLLVLQHGTLEGRVAADGRERDLRNRFLAVWRRSGDGFELLAWQSTGF